MKRIFPYGYHVHGIKSEVKFKLNLNSSNLIQISLKLIKSGLHSNGSYPRILIVLLTDGFINPCLLCILQCSDATYGSPQFHAPSQIVL